MISIVPQWIEKNNFDCYGIVYDLHKEANDENIICSAGDGYVDGYTKNPLIDTPGSLGMTNTGGLPSVVKKMEKHLHTQEAMMCTDKAIVFLVSADDADSPSVSSIAAFILKPGQVVVLHRGIWHSPALGKDGPTSYYWMAEAYEEDPTVWKGIDGGPVCIDCMLTEEY